MGDISLLKRNPTPDPLDSAARRNYWFALLNGVAVQFGMNITDAGMVLTVFLRQLGASNTLVGALPSLRFAGWYLPQLLVAGWIEGRERRVPTAMAMEAIRGGTYALLALLTVLWALSHPQWLLCAFLALFTLTRFTAGSGAVIRMELVGQLIDRRRWTTFFAQRSLGGGVMGILSGLAIGILLDKTLGPPFPINYGSLFLLSALGFGIGFFCFSKLHEGPAPRTGQSMSIAEQLRRAPVFLQRDAQYRHYVFLRLLLRLGGMAAPFYAIYATEVLGAPNAMVGVYVSLTTLTSVLSNLMWGYIGQKLGNVLLMRIGIAVEIVAPLWAWVTPLVGQTLGLSSTSVAYLFGLLFVCQGFSESGEGIGFQAFLLDIAPPADRPSYIGAVNTLLGLVSLMSIISGTLIDRLGYQAVFALALAFILMSLLASWRLSDQTTGAH